MPFFYVNAKKTPNLYLNCNAKRYSMDILKLLLLKQNFFEAIYSTNTVTIPYFIYLKNYFPASSYVNFK